MALKPQDYSARTEYRPPTATYRRMQWLGVVLTSLGLAPPDAVTLEVRGRKSGRVRRTPVVLLAHAGAEYVVALAGESHWVRNVRAADGWATIRRRGARSVRLVELPGEDRAPVIEAYRERMSRNGSTSGSDASSSYFGIDGNPTDAELDAAAGYYPVFRVDDGPPDPYRSIARCYDSVMRPIIEALWEIGRGLSSPEPGARVLDVGCGTGGQLALFREAGCEIDGVDTSPAMLAEARRRLGDGVRLSLVDGARLPYPDDTFDLVVVTLVLHELSEGDRRGVLEEVRRTVHADGAVLVTDYAFGRLRLPKGAAWRVLTHLFELAAGIDHYRNFRGFSRRGGIARLASQLGMTVERAKVVAGGNIGIYLLHPGG